MTRTSHGNQATSKAPSCLPNDHDLSGEFVGRHQKVKGCGTFANTAGGVVVRPMARAVVASEITCEVNILECEVKIFFEVCSNTNI